MKACMFSNASDTFCSQAASDHLGLGELRGNVTDVSDTLMLLLETMC